MTTTDTPHTAHNPPAEPDPRPTSLVRSALLAVALFLGAITLASCGGGDGGDTVAGPEQPTFEYVIPAGSGDLLAQGEPLDILPRTLETRVGETIQIINEDTIAHVLGPWFVGPGETLRQRFVDAGEFEGSCSVHPSGAFTVIVAEA